MCGRYTLTTPAEVVAAVGGLLAGAESVPELAPRYNIAPTQLAPVVLRQRGAPGPTIELLRWGLVPRWAKDLSIGARMINARSETLATKAAFRDALVRRRCLVLADGFYEWRAEGKRKQPIWIRREPRGLFTFAGLWERWTPPDGDPVHTFTIVTTAATAEIATLHDRMPLIIEPGDRERWLGTEALPPDALAGLVHPDAPSLVLIPVSMAANSVANDSPTCLEPPKQTSLF
jgi:putative SOS response-associated peptidase YedK